MSRWVNAAAVWIFRAQFFRATRKAWRRRVEASWTSTRQLTLYAVRTGRLRELTPRAVHHLVRSGGRRSNRIAVILEIGANDGEHTAGFLREFGKSCVIHAFEPEPRAILRFRARHFDHRVRLHEVALGEREGIAEFFQSSGAESEALPDGWHYSGSTRRPKNHLAVHPWVTFEHSIQVPVRTLDSWNDEVGLESVDFIWMDVQGAEADVISGGEQVLSNTRFLYTEYSDAELYEGQATLAQLTEALNGWRMVAQFPNDVLFENQNFESGRVAK